jgi:hypothetical protein
MIQPLIYYLIGQKKQVIFSNLGILTQKDKKP